MSKLSQFFTWNRWFPFVMGIGMALVSGNSYLFSSIAPSLKDRMNYGQYQISSIAFIGSLGSYICFVPNPLIGFRMTCIIAAVALFSGYFLLYSSVLFYFKTNYIVVGLFYGLVGFGSSASYMTAISTNIQNFSQQSRGAIVGGMASAYGLSAAIFGLIYKYGFHRDMIHFYLFLSIVAGSVPFISTIFMSHSQHNADQPEEKILLNEEANAVAEPSESINHQSQSTVMKDLTPLQMLFSIDFALLAVLMFAGVGSGLTITANLGNVVISYGGKDGAQNTMVILYSISNSAGRLISGYLSDVFRERITRITIFNFSLLGMALANYMFAFAPIWMFYPLVILAGASYGSMWAMGPSFMSDRYGKKYFAINFSILASSPALASYLLATLMASSIYKLHSREGSNNCYGKQCWQLTFFINCMLCVFAFCFCGLFLMRRAGRMYSEINRYHRSQKIVQEETA